MFYFDTSFIAPLYIPEPDSPTAREQALALADQPIAISEWTCVEFSSMVARRVRMRELTDGDALGLLESFTRIAHTQYTVLIPTQADYRLAESFLRRFDSGLRAGDALHLAIVRNHGLSRLFSLDQGLIRAAALLDIPAATH